MKVSSLIGDESQLVGVKRYRLMEGREKGVECVDVDGTNGLSFTVVVDRALDISALRFRGKNICYRSINGVSSPTFYSGTDQSRIENFFYGMLTTCGLENTGPGCVLEGEAYVRHGSLNQIPAKNVQIRRYGNPLQPRVRITGEVVQYVFGKFHYLLHRTIDYNDCTNEICVLDRVENCSPKDVPIFIMYHYNFGYPFLAEGLKLSIPSALVECRDEGAEEGLDPMLYVTPPRAGYRPKVFRHTFDSKDWNYVILENGELLTGVRLGFQGSTLPQLNQWNMFGEREYVLALEPCNQLPYGRKALLETNRRQIIKGYETVEYRSKLSCYQI